MQHKWVTSHLDLRNREARVQSVTPTQAFKRRVDVRGPEEHEALNENVAADVGYRLWTMAQVLSCVLAVLL